ncbi:MAG TPA: ABC-2 family transporter protein [Phycisphaerae bacterium]|nr:ABC-2 family transporter protein [Phycisphaerae bacterium]
MKRLISAIPAFVRASLQTMFQYRGEIALWAIWGVVYPAVAMAMWRVAALDPKSGPSIHGFEPADFAAYFLLTMIVGHICTAWDVYEFSFLVRTGRMSAKLLRPILPLWESLADNLAYKLLTLVILVPLWSMVAWWAQPRFTATAEQIALGVPAVLLAAALNYLLGYNLALLAFWLTRMDGIGECWFGASLFFGGRLAPLTIMPLPLQWAAAALPFKWVIWFPSAALMGRLPPAEIAAGLLYQGFWLAAMIVLFRWMWRTGVRRYSAVGA